MTSPHAARVPGDGADREVRWRLSLVHEELQVNTALISRHSHDGVGLSLVAFIEQFRDKPETEVECIH